MEKRFLCLILISLLFVGCDEVTNVKRENERKEELARAECPPGSTNFKANDTWWVSFDHGKKKYLIDVSHTYSNEIIEDTREEK